MRRVDSVGIEGMTCQSCISLIESTVGELSGVMSVRVSLECKEGVVEYDDGLISSEQIREAIDDMGFVITYVTGKQIHCSLFSMKYNYINILVVYYI